MIRELNWTYQTLQELRLKRGWGTKADGISNFFHDTVGVNLSDRSGWLSHETSTFCTNGSFWYFKFHFKASVFGARIHITLSWHSLWKYQEVVLTGWWWAVMFLRLVLMAGSQYWIHLATGVRLSTAWGNPRVLCYVSMGPSTKSLPCLTECDFQGWRFVMRARDSVLVG